MRKSTIMTLLLGILLMAALVSFTSCAEPTEDTAATAVEETAVETTTAALPTGEEAEVIDADAAPAGCGGCAEGEKPEGCGGCPEGTEKPADCGDCAGDCDGGDCADGEKPADCGDCAADCDGGKCADGEKPADCADCTDCSGNCEDCDNKEACCGTCGGDADATEG